jgi:hypothetical protein
MKKFIVLTAIIWFAVTNMHAQMSIQVSNVTISTASIGSTVNVPMIATTGYNNIGSIQLTVSFDPAVLTPVQVSSTNFGVINPCFQTTANGGTWMSGAGSGNSVSSNWYDPTFSGINIPNGAVIYELQFIFNGGSTSLNIITSSSHIYDSSYNQVQVSYTDGNLVYMQNMSVSIANLSLLPSQIGGVVNVPVTAVYGHNLVGSIQFSITYNPAVLNPVIQTSTNTGIANPCFETTANGGAWMSGTGSTGTLTATWYDPTFNGVLVQDNTVLFDLQFTYLGGSSQLNFNTGNSFVYKSNYEEIGMVFQNGGVTGYDAQNINLASGWSLISTYINPLNPNISDVINPVLQNVVIVKSGAGMVFWPQFSINQIGNMEIGQGYQIKMTTSQILQVIGTAVIPENTVITIPQGWSILGYLRNSSGSIVTLLSNIVSDVIIVKNGGGQVYWPYFQLNQIINMIPGEGYQIRMATQRTYNYPANNILINKSSTVMNLPLHYNNVINTGNNMTLGIPESLLGNILNLGDEIGVFSPKGKLVGSGVYESGNFAVTIWGNDNLNTGKEEGMITGEKFTLKCWNNTDESEKELIITDWISGSEYYEENEISVAGEIKLLLNNELTCSVYPNPFCNSVTITFSINHPDNVNISVINSNGKIASEIVNKYFDNGTYKIPVNLEHLSPGSYIFKIMTSYYNKKVFAIKVK